MNQPPLNPDGVLNAMDTLMAETDTDERATEWAHKVTTRVLEGYFAASLPEVTSVEQWDSLPIGTMVRVHFNGNSELVIRCPAGSGAGIGGMSFLGGRHWSDVFTVWNADKLEIKYIPEVKP